MKSGVKTTFDGMAKFIKGLKELPKTEVCVGIPEDTTDRTASSKITNAQIGYIAEHGAPERNIPARPWLVLALSDSKNGIANYMRQAGRAALEGKLDVMKKALSAAGITGTNAARNRVNAGIPPPLADSTLRARARRGRGASKGIRLNKGARAELQARAEGEMPSVTNAKPLVDTGAFRKSISYIVRKK